jgi:hypothetical protein
MIEQQVCSSMCSEEQEPVDSPRWQLALATRLLASLEQRLKAFVETQGFYFSLIPPIATKRFFATLFGGDSCR